MAGLLLSVIDQQSFLEVELAELFNVLQVLSVAPVAWVGDSGFEFRDLIVEFSRWVLGPGGSTTVDHRAPGRIEKGGISLITTGAALWSCHQGVGAALVPTPLDLVVNLRRSDEGTVGFVGNLSSSHHGKVHRRTPGLDRDFGFYVPSLFPELINCF